ncbi:MAG TPA: hypothetical protein VN176_00585 [Verrucomicrobiae bacterium]|jgi:hypothetical protein|nr:hypothetical protein [Verrucomicrobiae bacterium]
MTPWFIVTKQFTPNDGNAWSKYIQRSGLTQLTELVSLDTMLCPTLLPKIKDDYWAHIVNEDFMIRFFVDFDFLMEQVAGIEKKNVLCVFRNPTQQPMAPPVANFEFLGFDLLETYGSDTSALTNCEGFPDVFANSELSSVGLLHEFERAVDVQTRLRSMHPEEPHADCDLWAIFRAVGI